MKRLIDSGLLIRLSIVVANIWLIGNLTEAFTGANSLVDKVNLAAFGAFGVVLIVGCALVIQKTLEHSESRLSRTNRVARALPNQASAAYTRSRYPSNGRLGVAGRESGMEPIPIDWTTPRPTDR